MPCKYINFMMNGQAVIFVVLATLCRFVACATEQWTAVSSGNWSDPLVWQAGAVPPFESSVRISSGIHVLYDIDAPALRSLDIDQGVMTFAPMDLHLQSHFILLTNGGRLQAGTLEQPFAHSLRVTLLGNRTHSEEAPVYGAKAIAIAGGHLEMHGVAQVSWSRLAAHATSGSAELRVDDSTGWRAGQRLFVASTDFDFEQTEARVIRHVSGATVGLDAPLEYSHYGEVQEYGGRVLDERAEVGLLSRNIVIEGDQRSQREEFGCQIMATAGRLRLSNVEVSNCGQRSSLARYPLHFHLFGNASSSYVKNCSIHNNFNRAVALHGVHSALIKDNVVHNTKGHAVFVEDAIETKNIVQGNLVASTRVATSLLHTDQTPAAFWVTNPDNYFAGNVAAGSERYGFWFSLPGKPTGPSAMSPLASDMCPIHSPLGQFDDNKAHSCRKNGLHIYVEWTALRDGYGKHCSLWKAVAIPVFVRRFVAYKCRGAGYHAHKTGELRCTGCVFADNQFAWQHNQVTIGTHVRMESSLVVGQSKNFGNPTPATCNNADTPCCVENGVSRTVPAVKWHTKLYGVQIPFTGVIEVGNTIFANFRTSDCEYKYDSTTGWDPPYFNRYNHRIESHAMVNQVQWYTSKVMKIRDNKFIACGPDSSNAFKLSYSAAHDGANHAAFAAQTAHPSIGVLQNETIVAATLGALIDGCTERVPWNAYICPKQIRFRPLFVYNREKPASYVGPMKITGHGGATDIIKGASTIRFFPTLAVGQKYRVEFDKRTPLALEFLLQQTMPGDAILLEIRYDTTVAGVTVHVANHHWGDWYDSTVGMATSVPTLQSGHGSWQYSFRSKILTIAIRHSSEWASKVKVVATPATQQRLPQPCNSNGSNYFALPWSSPTTWNTSNIIGVTADAARSGMMPNFVPTTGDNVRVGCRFVVTLDVSTPVLGNVVVYGTLQFARKDLNLTAASIRILHGGVFAVGSADRPFLHQARIRIAGDRFNTVPTFGARVFAVSDGAQLQLHGHKSKLESTFSSSWTKLRSSARVGDHRIHTLARVPTTWANGTVVITAGGSVPAAGGSSVETAHVTHIADNDVISVSSGLMFSHKGERGTAVLLPSARKLDDRSAVGLLNRNVVIESLGGDTNIGCKIIVTNGSSVHMQNVEVKHCGQTQVSAAITVNTSDVHTSTSYIRDCSVHHSADSAIFMSGNAAGVAVEDNVLFSSAGPAIVVHSGAHNVRRNLAINSATGAHGRVGTYVFNTRNSPAFLIRTMRSVISGNMASGGPGSGFLFALGNLADWEVKNGLSTAQAKEQLPLAQLLNNTAADFALSGVTVSGWNGPSRSVLDVDGLVSYNNGKHGLHLWKSSLNIVVSRSVFANARDTGIAIESWFPANRHVIKHCVFVGATETNTGFVSASAAGIRIPKLLGGSQMVDGMLLPRTKNTCPCTYNQLSPGMSAIVVHTCAFYNYTQASQAALQSNAKGDGAPEFWASNLSFFRAAAVRFPSPRCQHSNGHSSTSVTTLLLPSGCDAASQAVIFDDGSIAREVIGTDARPSSIVTNASMLSQMYALATGKQCVAVPAWNAHVCPILQTKSSRFMPALFIESLDDDAFIRYMGPITFAANSGAGPANVVYGRQDDSGMHLSVGSIFMATLLANQTYLVSFGGTIPKHLVFSFRGALHQAGDTVLSVDLLLQYKRPALLRVFKDGVQLPNARQDCTTGVLRITVEAGSGAVYEVQESGERKDSCYCCSRELRALMRATLRLNMHISSAGDAGTLKRRRFEASFTRDVGSALGIKADRILVTSVRPGSIIVDFQVLAAENSTAGEAIALQQALEAQIADVSSELNNGDVTGTLDRSNSRATHITNATAMNQTSSKGGASEHWVCVRNGPGSTVERTLRLPMRYLSQPALGGLDREVQAALQGGQKVCFCTVAASPQTLSNRGSSGLCHNGATGLSSAYTVVGTVQEARAASGAGQQACFCIRN